MDLKDRIHEKKMEEKRLDQEGEQRLAEIKADADKSKYDMEAYEKGADKSDKRTKDILNATSGGSNSTDNNEWIFLWISMKKCKIITEMTYISSLI